MNTLCTSMFSLNISENESRIQRILQDIKNMPKPNKQIINNLAKDEHILQQRIKLQRIREERAIHINKNNFNIIRTPKRNKSVDKNESVEKNKEETIKPVETNQNEEEEKEEEEEEEENQLDFDDDGDENEIDYSDFEESVFD